MDDLKQTVEWIDIEKIMPYDVLDLHQECETRVKTDPFLVCNNNGEIEQTTMTKVTYKFYSKNGDNVVKTEENWIWDSYMKNKKFWMPLPLEPRVLKFSAQFKNIRRQQDVKCGMLFIANHDFVTFNYSDVKDSYKPEVVFEGGKIYRSFRDGTIRDKFGYDRHVFSVDTYFTFVSYNEPFITDSDLDKLFCEYAITNYRDMKILRDIVHEVNANQNFDPDKMQEIRQSLKESASITILLEFLRTFTCGSFNPNLGEDEFIKKHPWKKRKND